MAIFYTDLADTVEDARVNGGTSNANQDVLDVLRELHAYTKRVLCPAHDAPSVAAGSGSQVASSLNSAAVETGAKAEFQRQLSMAIAASVAREPPRPDAAQEAEEEREFQRRLREAMQVNTYPSRRLRC
jgi:hypothetical protein